MLAPGVHIGPGSYPRLWSEQAAVALCLLDMEGPPVAT